MQILEVILPSGESLTREEILRAFILLAEAEASFPMLSAKDEHLACLLMMPDVLEQKERDREDVSEGES